MGAELTNTIRKASIFVESNAERLASIKMYSIAFLSMSDMVSELVMMVRYHEQVGGSYAFTSLICVSLNLAMQARGVYVLNRKKSWYHQLREQVIVFSLMKPAVGVYRVISGHSDDAVNLVVDAQVEMTAIRTAELVAESIPGTIIQSLAMFRKGGDRSLTPGT